MRLELLITSVVVISCSLIQSLEVHNSLSSGDVTSPQDTYISHELNTDLFKIVSEDDELQNSARENPQKGPENSLIPAQKQDTSHDRSKPTFLERLEQEPEFYLSLQAYRNEIENINTITNSLMAVLGTFKQLSQSYAHAFKLEVAKQRQRLDDITSIGVDAWNSELGFSDSDSMIEENLIRTELLESFVQTELRESADTSEVTVHYSDDLYS